MISPGAMQPTAHFRRKLVTVPFPGYTDTVQQVWEVQQLWLASTLAPHLLSDLDTTTVTDNGKQQSARDFVRQLEADGKAEWKPLPSVY